jgi:hypothetical protein
MLSRDSTYSVRKHADLTITMPTHFSPGNDCEEGDTLVDGWWCAMQIAGFARTLTAR